MDPTIGLEAGREALRRFLAGDDDASVMQHKVAEIAVLTVPGCDHASIAAQTGGAPSTTAATDDVALALDEVQYRTEDGPCLTALRHRSVELTSIATEQRWPAFVETARAAGVRATLSTPLVAREHPLGAINLYSSSHDAFDDDAASLAAWFADQLGVAAARATFLSERAELAGHLQIALESRAEIEQAKGILMASQRCTPEEAFEILRRASQRENRKLRVIASELVATYASSSPDQAQALPVA